MQLLARTAVDIVDKDVSWTDRSITLFNYNLTKSTRETWWSYRVIKEWGGGKVSPEYVRAVMSFYSA